MKTNIPSRTILSGCPMDYVPYYTIYIYIKDLQTEHPDRMVQVYTYISYKGYQSTMVWWGGLDSQSVQRWSKGDSWGVVVLKKPHRQAIESCCVASTWVRLVCCLGHVSCLKPGRTWSRPGRTSENGAPSTCPRHSMYGIYAYIEPPNHPNVGIHGIHGASGCVYLNTFFRVMSRVPFPNERRGVPA